ncbi:AAA family ATPase [Acidobacteriia bacterium AH_259_A11_L15]|nr:AAA family ATPase [Acidobacteriia bacterium AH_259_A11_L15]
MTKKMNERSLIANASAFAQAYIPSIFVARQPEITRLRSYLAPLVRKQPIKNIWIHGPSGAGKTCVAKFLLNELEEQHQIKGVYVNCWETETFFSILDKVVRDFRILGAERLSTVYKMERLENYLQSKPLLIVLDELDKPSPKERDSIIYNLCGIPSVTLICICNSRYFYYILDSRVRSRLDAVLLEFKPYALEDVQEILRQRAELGLKPEAAKQAVLRKVARLANGDARIAIQTLRHAASYADVYAGDRIQADHVKSGHSIARNAKKKYVLGKLSDHHQLIYGIIQDFGEVRSGELWKEYLLRCKQAGMPSAAPRTFSLYIKKLEEVDLVTSARALGIKGNVRVFRVRR